MKLILVLLLSILMMSNNCTLKTKDLKNYKPEKFPVEQSYSKSSLKLVDNFKLEENEDCILSSVMDMEISANKLLVPDDASGIIYIYDYENGKFINKVIPELYIIDSIANSKYKPLPIRQFKLRYMKNDEYENRGLTPSDIKKIKSSFIKILNIKNKYYIMGLSYLPATCDEEKYNSLDNRTIIGVMNDKFEIENILPLEINFKTWAIPNSYTFLSNGDMIVSSSNFTYKENKEFDSLVTYSRYDSSGKFLYNIGYLPEKYSKNNLIYKEKWYPFITEIKDSVFILYPRDFNVYAPGQRIRFKLKNLPYSNDSGLVYINDLYRLKKIENSFPTPIEVGKILPISTVYTYNANGAYGVVTLIFDKDEKPMGFYYIAQEYDLSGNLIRQVRIDDEPGNQIRNFKFDKINNYLCILRKNKDGWVIEKYKW